MSPQTLRSLRRLEGRHVSVCLGDGTTLEDCELVSAGHGGARTLWLLDGQDNDCIVAADDVVDLWEMA